MLPRFRAVALAGVVALAPGCSWFGRAAAPHLYEGVESAGARPAETAGTALAGRTIVVDPGHGGTDTGAVGPSGLMEKTVNLGVALRLARMLQQDGARVILTRVDDRDVAGAGSTGPQELGARIGLANRFHADLFISVHHNASARMDADKQETQTYWRMDDPGPSRDAGAAIHRHLVLDLGLPKDRLLPGNYYVLRHSQVPAVLGEAAYMTDPGTEKLLADPARQEVEARAYCRGILEYFGRGVPRVQGLRVDPAGRQVHAAIGGDAVPVAPDAVRLVLDGTPLICAYDGEQRQLTAALPEGLPAGAHQVALQVRDVLGNASPVATAGFRVAPAPAIVLPAYAPGLAGHAAVPVAVRVLDAAGSPVADGSTVRWSAEGGRLRAASTPTVDGTSTNWFTPGGDAPARVTARAGEATWSARLEAAAAPFQAGVVSGPGGRPIARALVLRHAGDPDQPGVTVAAVTGPDGSYRLTGDPPVAELRVSAPGHRTTAFAETGAPYLPVQLDPLPADGLAGQVVLLDAEGGGADARGRSPAGVTAAEANAAVVQALAGYLRAAGARPVLTHAPQDDPPDPERVVTSLEQGANLYVTVAHGPEARPFGSHYPTSTTGKRLAGRLASILGGALGTGDGGARDDSTYPLIQTTCPAVRVEAPLAPLTPANLPELAQREAYAVYRGLREGPTATASLELRVHYRDGRPAPGAFTSLDVLWPGLTDGQGRWRYEGLEPGEHYVEAQDGTSIRRTWVVGLAPGERRTLELVLDPPDLPDDLGTAPSVRTAFRSPLERTRR